jgi:signal transduction histidine kinase
MRWEPVASAGCLAAALAEMLHAGVRSPVLLLAGVAAAGALALRPRFPLGAPLTGLAIFAVPVLAISRQVPMLGERPNSVALMVAWLLTVFFAGAQRSLRAALVGLTATAVVCALYAAGPGAPSGSSGNDVLAAALFSGVVPWLAGYAVAWQRRARANERALARAEVAAAAERSRIAREVHDLVAHSVSVMVVQAEAAEALLPTSPERTAESLRAVQSAGRQALGEMRRTVAALRSGDVAAAGQRLNSLPELLDAVRSAGLSVSVVTDGDPAELPEEVDRSAYRVLQEALTNVLRHSDRTGATVRLSYAPDRVIVSVIDEGRPVRRLLPGGHGLAGVRERVTALGGSVEAGPTHDGKHLVHATLPISAPT